MRLVCRLRPIHFLIDRNKVGNRLVSNHERNTTVKDKGNVVNGSENGNTGVLLTM